MSQTSSSAKKNYNVLALRGQDVDDMEVVEKYKLDPALAYTPALNDAALEKQRMDNIKFYMNEGMEEPEAKTKAMANMLSAKKNIDKLMK